MFFISSAFALWLFSCFAYKLMVIIVIEWSLVLADLISALLVGGGVPAWSQWEGLTETMPVRPRGVHSKLKQWSHQVPHIVMFGLRGACMYTAISLWLTSRWRPTDVELTSMRCCVMFHRGRCDVVCLLRIRDYRLSPLCWPKPGAAIIVLK